MGMIYRFEMKSVRRFGGKDRSLSNWKMNHLPHRRTIQPSSDGMPHWWQDEVGWCPQFYKEAPAKSIHMLETVKISVF